MNSLASKFRNVINEMYERNELNQKIWLTAFADDDKACCDYMDNNCPNKLFKLDGSRELKTINYKVSAKQIGCPETIDCNKCWMLFLEEAEEYFETGKY